MFQPPVSPQQAAAADTVDVINRHWHQIMDAGKSSLSKLDPQRQQLVHNRLDMMTRTLGQLITALPAAVVSGKPQDVRAAVAPARQSVTMAISAMEGPNVDRNDPLLVALRRLDNELSKQ